MCIVLPIKIKLHKKINFIEEKTRWFNLSFESSNFNFLSIIGWKCMDIRIITKVQSAFKTGPKNDKQERNPVLSPWISKIELFKSLFYRTIKTI